MRRIHLPKYRRARGDAEAERIVAAAARVEGQYAYVSQAQWELIRGLTPQETVTPKPVKPRHRRKLKRARAKDDNPNGPGSVLHLAIKKLTGHDIAPGCSCRSRIREMNRNGWTWALTHPQQIAAWLREEADKRGVVATDAGLLEVVRAAWHEVMTRHDRQGRPGHG